ncbi:hypothetical protein [Streptomyces sp. 2A115]|uniref:hypothetical protein n=1 Tax=Streptomyces sp. 2A115 TaxID=3457439 RepID=UPI003FD5B40E
MPAIVSVTLKITSISSRSVRMSAVGGSLTGSTSPGGTVQFNKAAPSSSTT